MRANCLLCEDYIGYLTTKYYCDTCRKIKNIQRVYGKEEVLDILVDICLRDEIKRENKINHAIKNTCYSPACKTYNTRSKNKMLKTTSNSELELKKE